MNFYAELSLIQLICMIFYMGFIIYFMWRETQSLFKLKRNYFYRFWSYVDIGIIICSWSSIGIYVWKYRELKRISTLFKQTNGYVFINLQLSTYVSAAVRAQRGIICLLALFQFFGDVLPWYC